jgi:predicted MPP superfamily phosphohydrolase
MSFIARIVLSMIVGDAICWLQMHHFLGATAHPWRWRIGLATFFGIQLAGLGLIIFSRAAYGRIDFLMTKPLISAVFIWHFLLVPPVLVISCAVTATCLVIGLSRRVTSIHRESLPVDANDISRRGFLAATLATAPAAICLGLTTLALPQLERFRVRRLVVPMPQLPPALDGLTIAHVSDLHVGRFTEGRILEEIVRATNDLGADLALLTGDLINYALHDLPHALDLVKAMRARYGVVMCEGNHDLIEDPHQFVIRTKAAGVPLLVNESLILSVRGQPLQLLGLRWGSSALAGSRFPQHGDEAIASSWRELSAQRQVDAFPILLAHHPHAFDFAHEIPLVLAGHTHGGQLMLNERTGCGPLLFRYWSGLYRAGNRALVVSNGVGNWFPLRTRAPAEIIHLTLRRG